MRLHHATTLFVICASTCTAQAQTLIGSTVTVTGKYPTFDNEVTFPASAVVAAGVEFTELIVRPGYGVDSLPVAFDVGANSIDIGYGYSYSGSGAPYDGPVFAFTDLNARITGVVANTASSPNFEQIEFTWTDSEVRFDFARMDGFSPGANFRFDVSLAPVPEPASVLLLLLGIPAIAAAASRRKRSDAGA